MAEAEKTMTDRTYRTREFAALAGVTARTLHHYDRLGLLTPSRTDAGYRVYVARDLETLSEIVVLKLIGIPLRRIATLRRGGAASLTRTLRAQRHVLAERRALLDRTIAALDALERLATTGHAIHADAYRQLIEVIEMQNDTTLWTKSYDDLVKAKIERLKTLPDTTREQLRLEWQQLVEEIRRHLHEDPSGERAQAFARRWADLLAALMGQPIDRADLAKQPQEWHPRMASFVDEAVWSFMQRAMALAGLPLDPTLFVGLSLWG